MIKKGESMDINIEKRNLKYLSECEDALLKSELGRRYFSKCASSSVPISFKTPIAFLLGIVKRWERYLIDAPISPSGPPYSCNI